jgi:hypothetical protein
MLDPMVEYRYLSPPSSTFIPTQFFPFARADHDLIPLFLVPFRWKLLPEYRANLVFSPPSPPLPNLRAPVLRFSTLPTLLRAHREISPSARGQHYCSCGNERL